MKPLLAADCEGDVTLIKYPCYASPKIDGFRALKAANMLATRSFKPVKNKHAQELFKDLEDGFDGELVDGSPTDDPFNRTQSSCTTVAGAPNLHYYVFDFFGPECYGYEDRYALLKRKVAACKNKRVHLVPHKLCKNAKELLAFEEWCLAQGYEGVMVRRPDGQYKEGRSTLKEGILIKVKRFSDDEAAPIDFEEMMHNTNEAKVNELGYKERSTKKAGMVGKGTLGAIVAKVLTGKFKGKIVRVGTGFNDKQRAEIWLERPTKVFTFKHFIGGTANAPRFPVFKGWRTEK